jgi:hypothetical protein
MKQPYAIKPIGLVYWTVVDTRSGANVSYPTSKRQALAERDTMNAAYLEAIGEERK